MFQWRLRDEWLAPAVRSKDQAAQQAQQATAFIEDNAANALLDGGMHNGFSSQQLENGSTIGDNATNGTASPVNEYTLRHIFTTPEMQASLDLVTLILEPGRVGRFFTNLGTL